MSQAIANPLQSLLEQAAKQPTSGAVSRLRSRASGASGAVVILADTSASMSDWCGPDRKIDVLRRALSDAWPQLPGAHLIAFSTDPWTIRDPGALPPPGGSTALDRALAYIERLRPARTLVISDGRPDHAEAALAAADRITGRIDVIYCGPETDHIAIEFLQRLARDTGGTCHVATPAKGAPLNLIAPVRRLLLCGTS